YTGKKPDEVIQAQLDGLEALFAAVPPPKDNAKQYKALRDWNRAAVEPRVMGIGPVPAVRKLVERLGLAVADFDVIELNEAFASQGLAVLRELGLADDAAQVNPNGGAIALGHPLGMSGARLVLTALHHLEKTGGRRGLATMCVGVGQGLALAIER
ncbi:hypothetical protein RX986_10325, partial [Pseudomonas syringae pv. actinidiae]|nr:hypothetical protein [Pseudomonas syringae pv. actinidiae]